MTVTVIFIDITSSLYNSDHDNSRDASFCEELETTLTVLGPVDGHRDNERC